MAFRKSLHDLILRVFYLERRLDPYFRDGFDRLFQKPLVSAVQAMIRWRRRDARLGLAQERVDDDEQASGQAIIEAMSAFTRRQYQGVPAERAGNTKTYGVVRGRFEVPEGLAPELRMGMFERPAVYPAWVRFAGPGPTAPPDMLDNGVLSIGIKVMGVPGPKLIDDERE